MTPEPADDGPLPAGSLTSWVAMIGGVLRDGGDSDVPCGGCTACCTSAQFVHIEPDELDTLAHIPAALAFPAPGLPAGHVLLGYDERGHCPMLVEGACSIYAHRPRTCRAYDCRVFAATGVDVGDDGKAAIAERVARWRFDLGTDDDRRTSRALHAAAAALLAEPGPRAPASAIGRAVTAVRTYERFLGPDST